MSKSTSVSTVPARLVTGHHWRVCPGEAAHNDVLSEAGFTVFDIYYQGFSALFSWNYFR